MYLPGKLLYHTMHYYKILMCVYSEGRWESIVSQWQAHWPLELDGPGMIPAADKETASLRKYVPSCHLQE